MTAALGTRDYYRARLGIGRPPGRMDPADFVLRDFSAAERDQLPELLVSCADAVTALLADGPGRGAEQVPLPLSSRSVTAQ